MHLPCVRRVIESVDKMMEIKWEWINTSSKSNQFVSMSSLLVVVKEQTESNMLDILKGIDAHRIYIRLHWIDFDANIYGNHSHYSFCSAISVLHIQMPAPIFPFHSGYSCSCYITSYILALFILNRITGFKSDIFFVAETYTKWELCQ